MNKNTNYIIGLISIICISVVINGCMKKTKEGYTEMTCSQWKKAISEYFNKNPNAIKTVDAINKGKNPEIYNSDRGDVLQLIILCMYLVGGFDNVMNSYPNFFNDLFNNTEITDSDFIILKNAYNLLNTVLIDLLTTLLAIDYRGESVAAISPIQIVDKQFTDNIFNGVNGNIKILLLNLEAVVLTIQNPKDTNQVSSNGISMEGVNAMADIYFGIENITECARSNAADLFSDVNPNNKKKIFPFLRLIRDYIYKLANSINTYFVPALNAKLKEGQIKIITLPPPPPPTNPKAKEVVVDQSSSSGGITFGNPLLQGVGGATPS